MDVNNDGILTQSERVAAAAFTSETLPNGVTEAVAEFMSKYDANSDDVFTLEEWKDYILYDFNYRLVFGRKKYERR